MYCEHFGLRYPPFKITPDTQMFYTGGKRGLVLDALVYAITGGEGIVKVVGEVGSGKTMLCRMLGEKLPDNVDIVYLANPRLTPDTILQAIALEMGLPEAEQDTPPNHLQLTQALHKALLRKHAEGRHAVVLIEEAQGMPVETLEEIRLLSNLETRRDKLLQMVLFGQPELDENLASTHIRQLRERITHSFYLAPLERADLVDYLNFRMRAAAYKGPCVFSKGALKLMHKASKGLLRRVNILADKALLATFADGGYLVQATHIKRAVADSGFPDYATPLKRFSRPLWGGVAAALSAAAVLLWLHGNGSASASLKNVVLPHKPAALPQASPTPLPAAYQNIVPTVESMENTALLPDTAAVLSEDDAPAPDKDAPSSAPPPPAVLLPLTLRERLTAGLAWLDDAAEDRYTIQLAQIAEGREEHLEKLLRHTELESLLGSLYVCRMKQGQRVYWSVLYADFPDADTARTAIEQLPKLLRRNQPFLLTLRQIKQQITG